MSFSPDESAWPAKLVVIGSGIGLYTTLLDLRDRGCSLTVVVSGLPRAGQATDRGEHLGALPRDDASLALLALAPAARGSADLRHLLTHRMESRPWRGTRFGAGLLQALEETTGSRQAALEAAGQLFGLEAKIAIAMAAGAAGRTSSGAQTAAEAIIGADMIVIAPGDLRSDLMPLLCCPGIIPAIQRTAGIRVLITKRITEPETGDEWTGSDQVAALSALTGCQFDLLSADSDTRLAEARAS